MKWTTRLLIVAAVAVLLRTTAPAQTLVPLLTNGPTATRLNIVFLSEGYTAGQLNQFTNDARAVLNNLLATAPFNAYPAYFNAYAIAVASNESGSDHPSRSQFRDTYFNSTYDSYGIARLVTIPPNDRDGTYANGQGKAMALLQQFMPEYDIVVMVVNDTEYGGSGGSVLVTSVNASAPEIAVHELGHTFAGLGDEYATPFPGYPDTEEPNTTTQTTRSLIKWLPWILPATPVPTPANAGYASVVGLFEGAHYHDTGWFRPKLDCKMRSLGVPFCEVCSEALVKSIYSRVRPIEGSSPGTNPVITLTNIAAAAFNVVPLQPAAQPLAIQWFTNNSPVAGATSAVFNVTGFSLPPGTNTLRVEVNDTTAFVRTDADALLKEFRSWTIVTAVNQPLLQATIAGARVTVAWQTNATGFQLESTTGISPAPAWSLVLDAPTVVGNQNSVSFDLTNLFRFFRMRKP